MDGDSHNPVVPLWAEAPGASEDASADRSASPHLDSITEVDDTEDGTDTVAGKQYPRLDPETMIREYHTLPISHGQLEKEVKNIYNGLSMVEYKCVQVAKAQMPPTHGPLDVTEYLLMIPYAILIQLQDARMQPEVTIRNWYIEAQEDAARGDIKLSDPNDCLLGFRAALELRAEEQGWPEFEQLVVVNANEIDTEDRKRVMEEQDLLDIGDDLVDRLLLNLETAIDIAEKHEAAQANKVNIADPGETSEVDAVTLDERKKSESAKALQINREFVVDMRPLNDKNQYRKVGNEWWVLSMSGRWVPSLSGLHYSTLLVLHRTCLNEHHDFFMASQHPMASPVLRGLADKYAMQGRMWKHAIHGFLEVLRYRLPESHEIMDGFIKLAYSMMCLMDETVPQSRSTWIECTADVARYAMATENKSMTVKEHWRVTAKERYTQVMINDPTVGRLYIHLAILVRPRDASPDAMFDAQVSRLFLYTKSLVVKTPYSSGRVFVLNILEPIVEQNEKAAEEPGSVPQTDQDHFLTAVTHLILASLEPETLKKKGYTRKDHIQAVYAAVEKIKVGGPVKAPRIRPNAQLGLLLCHLLLGVPLAGETWSPMMAVWAPDLVTAKDRADSVAMAKARDIHDATIELISTMVSYLLEDPDTRDLGVWEFIYVILAFMRSMRTRIGLLLWLGPAFHAEMIAPYLNMLLREDETRGRNALQNMARSEVVTVCSPLNESKKPGKYALSTEDNIKNHYRKQEKRKAKLAESTATPKEGTVTTDDDAINPDGRTVTTAEATINNTAHEMGSELLYANVLPEHVLLSGLFFARQAEPEPCDEPLKKPTEDAGFAACPAIPEDAERMSHELDKKAREERERKAREAREAAQAEVLRLRGLHRDPAFFPHGWMKKSKHSFDDMRVCDYVQSFEMCNDRSNQTLRLAVQLLGYFFRFESDEEQRIWFSVPGASSVPEPNPNKKMPEVFKRDNGVRVVYVDPGSRAAEIQAKMERLAKEQERLAKEQERRKEKAEATTKVATVVDEEEVGAAVVDKKEVGATVVDEKGEDEWTHISDESHGDAEPEPAVQTDQAEARSMISHLFFRG